MELKQLRVSLLAGTLGQGGAERQLFFILRALRQSGAEVRLLCLSQNEFWEDRIRALGVPVTWVGQGQGKLGRLLRILAELRKAPPAVFQSQHIYTNAYVATAARWLGLAGIGALRGNGFNEVLATGRIGGWLSLHTPRVIAANSRAAIQYASEHGVRADRLYFLPNAVDTQPLDPAVARSEGPVRLVAVGSLLPGKRFDRFLSVLARLRSDAKKAVCGLIVGAGPLRGQLEKHAGALGLLPAGVEFRGGVSDVASVYREADIGVLTSDYEGTPNVLLEAMASGLPVVATKVGGVPEIVKDGRNGFVVEPADEAGLYFALLRLIDDPELRWKMGRQARAYVDENHSPSQLPKRLSELYQLAVACGREETANASGKQRHDHLPSRSVYP